MQRFPGAITGLFLKYSMRSHDAMRFFWLDLALFELSLLILVGLVHITIKLNFQGSVLVVINRLINVQNANIVGTFLKRL